MYQSVHKEDPDCAKTDALLFEGNAISATILVDICGTVLDQVKITSALEGPGLVVEVSYKKRLSS